MITFKEKLDGLVDSGWLISQTHPTLDLTIYNYSQKTQYEKYWTPETLAARGLVLNSDGDVVARPFTKFFNLSEVENEVPNLPFEVYEKMDGSLGIAFFYQDELVFASRGSFTSEQAVRGREILNKYQWETGMYPGYTYLFEIIYPANRIVVDYGETEELFVLGVIETATGRECKYTSMTSEGFILAKQYDFTDYRAIQGLNWENSEGFVVRFSNGYRVKIKFEDYVRLHRIMTNTSTLSVWDALRNGQSLQDYIENVPDEFYDWVRETARDLYVRYENISRDYAQIYKDILHQVGEGNRKAFAEEAVHYPHSSILFNMLDGKSNADAIWKILRPKFSKPFVITKE